MDTSSNPVKPLVSISCIAYNQRDYIRQTLEGFLSQKTDFAFEVLIHDDCSTDGTDRIIAEYAERYPHIIKPMFEKENQFSLGKGSSLEWNLPRAKGKYFALCEGDDYWTDPLKLQKQADYMEAHPEVGLCYTNFNLYYQNSGKLEEDIFTNFPDKYPCEYESAEAWVLRNGYTAPPTWLMRTDLMPKDIIPTNDTTFVLFTHFIATSRVKYLPFTSATYRILDESAAHSKNYEKRYRRNRELLEVKFRLIDHYGLKDSLKNDCIEKYYRQGLPQFVFNNKKEDIAKARTILHNIGTKERIMLLIDSLGCNKIAAKLYSLLRKS